MDLMKVILKALDRSTPWANTNASKRAILESDMPQKYQTGKDILRPWWREDFINVFEIERKSQLADTIFFIIPGSNRSWNDVIQP
jgi:hypothetical protein